MSMGGQDVDGVISKLKERFGVTTDRDLAKRLHLGRTTVANWRNRGQVPQRYVEAAEDGYWGPFRLAEAQWTEEERAAVTLAIMRLMRDHQPLLGDFGTFMHEGGTVLWLRLQQYQHRALKELTEELADLEEVDIGDGHKLFASENTPWAALVRMIWREFFEDAQAGEPAPSAPIDKG